MTDEQLDRMFNNLKGRFRHWCPEWDDLPIDETMPEFECCTCYSVDGEFIMPEDKAQSEETR